jgi:hypothetical protein
VAEAYDGRHDHGLRARQYRIYVRPACLTLPPRQFDLITHRLWNYNPDNDDTHGDDWNGENFSWFSNSRARAARSASAPTQELDDDDDGARILDAVVRPYAAKTAGTPQHFDYEMATGAFRYSWTVPPQHPGEARETEIFVPERLARGRRLVVEGLRTEEDGDTWTYDVARQTLFVLVPATQTQTQSERMRTRTLRVRFDPPVGGEVPNDAWSDFARPVGAVGVVILALVAYYLL